MKRLVVAGSYAGILRDIHEDLTSLGLEARINKNHKCVDVLENGRVIEQHYPEFDKEVNSKRGKFIYVGEGNGDYVLDRTPYLKKEYKKSNHLIKHVSKSTRSNS